MPSHMNAATMRRVDRYLGIPLCFLFSTMLRLYERIFPRQCATPGNVLFIELAEMGNVIMADPAMRKLRRETSASLHFAIFQQNREGLQILSTVPRDNVCTLRVTSLFALFTSFARFLWWTRNRKIDTVVNLEAFARFSSLMSGLSGAANRVGFYRFHNEGLYCGDFLTHRVAYNPHLHIAKNYLALVHALLSENSDTPHTKAVIKDRDLELPSLAFGTRQKAAMQKRLRQAAAGAGIAAPRFVLVNANASDLLPQRRWGRSRFAEVITGILGHADDIVVLLVGAAGEWRYVEKIRTMAASPRCVNFAGGCSLVDLPLLCSLSLLMLSNDSGPPHFAAPTGIPVFVLFGPETPLLYSSLGNCHPIYAGLACSPCVTAWNHKSTPCKDNKCLAAISPQEVLNRLRPWLAPGRPRQGEDSDS